MAKIDINAAKRRLLGSSVTFSASADGSGKSTDIEYVDTVNDNIFIFKTDNTYVFSPADDTLDPIIGEFDEIPDDNSMPPCLQDWLKSYSNEIDYFQENEETLINENDITFGSSSLELIDLGLSVRWANMNLGAITPESVGSYYAWGETEIKSNYTLNNYKFYIKDKDTYTNIGSNISKTEYDIAYKQDKTLCLPTEAQWIELQKNCKFVQKTVNGITGYEITGPSGKSIFLPFAGCTFDNTKAVPNTDGYYMTATASLTNYQEKCAKIGVKNLNTIVDIRKRTGISIRPVSSVLVKDENKLVDLGLSVNWANMNLGAKTEEDSGNYYAWAEPTNKTTFTWSNYKYYVKIPESYKFIGENISQNKLYDAAFALSDKMFTPTSEQWQELFTKCKFELKTINNVSGYEITGTNGNSIFMPLSGNSYEGKICGVNSDGYYMSSSFYKNSDYQFNCAKLLKTNREIVALRKRTGTTIRPVSNSTGTISGYMFIDLGLSVNWANMNLGANDPYKNGSYYAWGETETKTSYNLSNYKYYTAASEQTKDLGKCINKNDLYDAAYLIDKNTCIPTITQWEELYNKCKYIEKTVNNIKGLEFTGPNGNSIFIPYTGYISNNTKSYYGTRGYYESADTYSTNVNQNRKVCLNTSGKNPTTSYVQKYVGLPIRPVSVKTNNIKKTVNPLIPYKWAQGAPYSNLLPTDPSTGKTVVTGCTNTAMAMIVAYYGCIGVNNKLYKRGCGSTDAYKKGKCSLPALSPIMLFDYDNLNFIKAADFKTTESKQAVAELMKYIGYASQANYSSSGTSTSVSTSLNVAKNKLHIGPSSAKIIYASSGLDGFKNKVYNELIQGYPVHLSGWNSKGSGGHSFICDGYDSVTDKFHFNWGWSGNYDGWFDMAILKANTSNDFSYNKQAMIGLHPEYIFGDLNTDNNVDVHDVMSMVQSIIDKKAYNYKFDINSDNTVDINDVYELLQIILK